jgi:hypothetical protein
VRERVLGRGPQAGREEQAAGEGGDLLPESAG